MLFEPEFWVTVSVAIFVAIVWKLGGFDAFVSALDARSKRIANELAEARRLREDAAALLREYEAKRQQAEREAAEIVAAGREQAERIARDMQEKMADFVKRRTAAAEAKIAQAEAQAAAEVRAAAINAAVAASERVLRSEIRDRTAEELVARGLDQVRARLS